MPTHKAQTPDTYVSPLPAGQEFEFVSASKIYPYPIPSEPTGYWYGFYKQDVLYNGNNIFTHSFQVKIDAGVVTIEGTDEGYISKLSSGIYQVVYTLLVPEEDPSKASKATYTFQVVQNQYPLKKPTVKDVIERILRLCEPLVWDRSKGDYVKPPRFKFAYKYPEDTEDGKAERALFAQVSPEFTFTRSTLREQLQEIGKFIHAEPRLLGDMRTFIFDRYGEQDLATYERIMDGAITPFNQHPYKGKRFAHDIGVACTIVESDVDNFVNRLDKKGGTITEPYRGGAITLRTDTAYLRLEDSEGLYYPTSRPVMDITKMFWLDFEGLAGTPNARYEITPYLFEKNRLRRGAVLL